jgi:Fic family protein
VKEAGKFRSGDVGVFDGGAAVHIGVFDGGAAVHIGARPQFVPGLVANLFAWAKTSELHPVLKSAILHYEIETIHPFADGNGRMGRLWQTLLLAKWNSIFAWVPMETILNRNRNEYYGALYYGQHSDDSSRFIEFILFSLLETLKKINADLLSTGDVKHQVKHQVKLTETQNAVLKALEAKPLSRKEIFAAIGMNSDSRAYKRHIEPLLEAGLISMTIPGKPNSRNQKYVKA